jgi:hypothetical protein
MIMRGIGKTEKAQAGQLTNQLKGKGLPPVR